MGLGGDDSGGCDDCDTSLSENNNMTGRLVEFDDDDENCLSSSSSSLYLHQTTILL